MALRDVIDAVAKAILITFWWYVGLGIRGYVEASLDARHAHGYHSIVQKEDR